MPEQISKYPDVTLQVLKERGARCGEALRRTFSNNVRVSWRQTYVSFSQQLSGGHGREVSLKYQIASDWKIGTSANSTGANGIEMIWHERC